MSGSLRRIDVADVLAEPPPPLRWVLPGFVEFGEVLNLAGRGKVGKSIAALFVAVAGLSGGQFCGLDVAPLDWAVYLDAENPEKTIRRRIHFAGVPASVADRLHLYSARGLNLSTAEGLEEFAAVVPAEGSGLVVIDSVTAVNRADDNASREVRAFVDGVRRVVEGRDAATILLGHENRTGDLRGSLDWRNATDGTLQMTRDDDGWRTLAAVERRDGEEADALHFRFEIGAGPTGGASLGIVSRGGGGAKGGAKGGANQESTAVERMAERLLALMVENPEIALREAARRFDLRPDNGTLRRGWSLARGQLLDLGPAPPGPKTGPEGAPPFRGAPDGPDGLASPAARPSDDDVDRWKQMAGDPA